MSNGKDMIVVLIVELIKKDLIPHIKMSYHFLKPFKSFGGNIDVKVDVSNYATKTDLKMLETLILQVLH